MYAQWALTKSWEIDFCSSFSLPNRPSPRNISISDTCREENSGINRSELTRSTCVGGFCQCHWKRRKLKMKHGKWLDAAKFSLSSVVVGLNHPCSNEFNAHKLKWYLFYSLVWSSTCWVQKFICNFSCKKHVIMHQISSVYTPILFPQSPLCLSKSFGDLLRCFKRRRRNV